MDIELNPETLKKTVCYGIITAGDITIETMFSIVQSMKTMPVATSMVIVKGCYVTKNRNEMIHKALQTGATHVLSVDTDVTFDETAVIKLLNHNKDIVGANYNKRQFPITPIVKDLKGDELQQVEFIPGGFMLINLDVFKKIEAPWFDYKYEGKNHIDDDVFFCRKAKEAGFEVWCDPTIKIGHIGTVTY